jgi:hypothetical protein
MREKTYKITVHNFFKHNSKIKKGHTHFMLSKRFFYDEKISKLKPIEFRLYTYLLSVCADLVTDQFPLSAQMLPRYFHLKDHSMTTCILRLQSFQLVTLENENSLIEENRIEKKGIEKNRSYQQVKKQKNEKTDLEQKEQNKKIWDAYFNAYRLRYGVDQIRNASINSQVAKLRSKLGLEDSLKVVEFFLQHNDSWYIKNTHSFGLCLKDCDTLRTQMLRGKL